MGEPAEAAGRREIRPERKGRGMILNNDRIEKEEE
jgi:hypothetical protein